MSLLSIIKSAGFQPVGQRPGPHQHNVMDKHGNRFVLELSFNVRMAQKLADLGLAPKIVASGDMWFIREAIDVSLDELQQFDHDLWNLVFGKDGLIMRLHSHLILHGDLTPENIVLRVDQNTGKTTEVALVGLKSVYASSHESLQAGIFPEWPRVAHLYADSPFIYERARLQVCMGEPLSPRHLIAHNDVKSDSGREEKEEGVEEGAFGGVSIETCDCCDKHIVWQTDGVWACLYCAVDNDTPWKCSRSTCPGRKPSNFDLGKFSSDVLLGRGQRAMHRLLLDG